MAFTEPQPYCDEDCPAIAMQPVDSSQLKAIGYDEASQTLAVTFARGTGAIYHYPNVDKKTFDDFLAAESAGNFFGANIKALPFKKYPAFKITV